MAVTTGSEHTVDVLGTNGTSGITKVQPSNGTGTIRTSIGSRRGRDGVELLARQVHSAVGEGESWDTLGVEEVVAEERNGAHIIELERSIGRERVGLGSTREAGVCTALRRRVEVERDLMTVKSLGRQSIELITAERAPSLARVEVCDVVEHGEGTGGGSCSANLGAGVVLDTEAKGDVLELSASRRLGQVLTCKRKEN